MSLRLGDKIGALAAGFDADIIAVYGDPLKDITSLGRVVFVMKSGKVTKTSRCHDVSNAALRVLRS